MRKKFITKILPFIFVFIFISLFISSPLAFRSPRHARAENVKESGLGGNYTEVYPRLSVPVGEFGRDCAGCYTSSDPEACFKQCKSPFEGQDRRNWLGLYIIAWFNYIVGAAGIFAVYRVMYGGIKWITAGGNASSIDEAKTIIGNAIKGVVLLLCAYTIFKTINPRLLSLQLPPIEPVEPEKVCCRDKDGKRNIRYTECLEEEVDLKDITLCGPLVPKITRVCTVTDIIEEKLSQEQQAQEDFIKFQYNPYSDNYNDTNFSDPSAPKSETGYCGDINYKKICMYAKTKGICVITVNKGGELKYGTAESGRIEVEGKQAGWVDSDMVCGSESFELAVHKFGSKCDGLSNCWAKKEEGKEVNKFYCDNELKKSY